MIVGSLLIACDRLFPYSASVDVESGSPRYFCHVFFQFHDNTQFLQDEPVPNNLDNWGITPLSQLMRELNEGSINHMLDVAKFLLLWQHSEEKFTRTAIEQAITNCVDEIMPRVTLLPKISPDMACLLSNYMLLIVYRSFFDDVGTNLEAILAYGSDQIGAYDRLLLANEVNVGLHIDRLYSNLANIVWYTSPLIDTEYMPGEDMVDHVASRNLELYEDEDWFTRELHLQGHLEDVLHGPEHITKDEVSDPLAASNPSPPPCDICGDTNTTTRKLKACQHHMCEDCLTAQLDSQHACRYKCPFCRANFLSSD
ncbi:hypothetical protein HBI56_083550 [Parastagonospora nodorum]|nr:hypothetical protein HBH51_062380 [Parastagonospora nodorum]KAH3999221.1 hypothetical protein HBI10_119020 [Parastagonospora nodorum]KAH4025161.1 hypothetical protein HBI13_078170 [Parastagonospora nodorum]KAH4122668.1 hypothetical protein HBH47_081580 [Parastagonospora nodorum]KAH4346833.1 hypothetical protein HBH98_098670 [Parastagonospora nodorum]